MEFTSYQLISNQTASLNTGSYLNRVEYSLFGTGFVSDMWYGLSANDAIEVGVWDREENLIAWNTLHQSKSYNQVTLSYINTLNVPVNYSYRELRPDFILYKNENILISPPSDLSSSFKILSGSYILTYNFTREMAGTPSEPLVVKDISPSRRELKLVPLSGSTLTYDAFCQKKIPITDVSSLYIDMLKGCPYSNIYSKVVSIYPKEIDVIKQVFFLTSDAAVVTFFKNLYEDFYIYSRTPDADNYNLATNTNVIRIQGIQTYFTNYLLSNSDKIVDFSEIDGHFQGFVSASIEKKFAPIGLHPIKPYVDAKAFVFDFFTKYFYTPISQKLAQTYNEKYYSPLKNALNFGNNRLLPIINNGMLDERIDPSEPLTLLVKLQSELPNDIQIQTSCWVSNISLVPYIVDGIFRTAGQDTTYKIGAPNFSIPIPNASLTNTNTLYTADDLKQTNEIERELTLSKNIQELSVDYTDFNNFVVFSSAEVRLKIFKNKCINISTLSSSLNVLESKNVEFLGASGSIYPYYSSEYSNIQGQINNIINSFDGFESYLYRSGNYIYQNGNFISSSYVVEMDLSASAYDRDNRDSLVNNCPEHILSSADNDDYIIFLTMIGHFFDNIYIYISNIPSQKQVGNSATEEFTRRITDYMLQTFGWNLDDSLEHSNILNNYLSSDQIIGLNKMSSEERLKIVRNRLLVNLPQIYKTKGTTEAVKLILACYGIPSTLLSIREYGGVNYTDEKASYTTYERVFMRQWDTSSKNDTYFLHCPTGSHTILFKILIDDTDSYAHNVEHTLVGNVPYGVISSSISASGKWAIGFSRSSRENMGKMFFRIGYSDNPVMNMWSEDFPLFNGEIYSVMVRRNAPHAGFEYTSNTDVIPSQFDLYVQRNEGGERILRLSSSYICYDTQSNILFSGGGGWLNIGNWFSEINNGGYTGCFDKFQVWLSSLSDNDFEDYTNNINSYAFSGSNPHESLAFRMHTDYPMDMRQYTSGSLESLLGIPNTNWRGLWRNANPFFASGSEQKLQSLYGWGANVDYMVNYGAWEGTQTLVTNSCSPSGYVSASCYPYQFKIIDYPSTWPVSKYGPNKFRNEKIRHISQSIEARFDNQGRSTRVPSRSTTPDSNQVGFFVDPQDFKNRDIIRYFGNFDLMDSIGDPSNQFSESYASLKTLRKEYADAHTPLSGSKTLFTELFTLFKLYFNRSVFESIKNVVPARSNTLIGILIDPTIIERPKYQSKAMVGEANERSVFFAECTASHYFRGSSDLYHISMSIDSTPTTSIDMTFNGLSTITYPVNYGGMVIDDYPDVYMMGHFAGGILTNEELESLGTFPTVDFYANPLSGPAEHTVQFSSNCFRTDLYYWDFGDGTSSTEKNPIHNYQYIGSYTVQLTGSDSRTNISESAVKYNYIVVQDPEVNADFEVTPTTGEAGFTTFLFNNLSINALTYLWDFGDGTTSTETNPQHIYDTPGDKTVTLTAYNGEYSDTEIKSSIINVGPAAVPCSTSTAYNGGATYPSEHTINLGPETGIVTLKYDSYTVPDMFVVVWDGVEYSSSYVGLNNESQQMQLENALMNANPPTASYNTIIQKTNSVGHYGQGSLTFTKDKRDPQTAKVYVYAPIGSTDWSFEVTCPDV